MLMTQTPVLALQGQKNTATNSSYNHDPNQLHRSHHNYRQQRQKQQQFSDSTSSVSGESSAGRVDSYNTYFTIESAMNGIVGSAPPGAMYVKALYDYEADDRTSLSFHEGDIIQVITRLESGWWDGVINGVRGWFPSNYCQIISSPDELPELEENGGNEQLEEEPDDAQEVYEESFDDDESSDQDEIGGLSHDANDGERSRADFWIPQATPDGRLFYYNTMTGESSMELPLESPSSVTETGPRDRMNVVVPDRTRPPAEMIARGLTQDEEDESDVNSASELEGEALMRSTMVCQTSSPSWVAPYYSFAFLYRW